MSADPSRSPMRVVLAAVPVVMVAAAAIFALSSLRGSDSPPAPVEIDASGARFDSIDQLIDASDVIVEGRIVRADTGRTITDPANPNAGVVTALFQLDVETVHRGLPAESLIVEQEATLLDGTPIIVNGLEPNRVGDSGFWFLIRGRGDEFPYLALVNEQGRMLADEAERVVHALGDLVAVDDLRAQLSRL